MIYIYIYIVADKVCADYINTGRAEPYSGNIEFVKNYAKKRNNTYLDIGANMGTHSVVYSKIFNNIIAFEPDTLNYEFLQNNIKLNKVTNILAYNKALSSRAGLVSTAIHSTHSRGCIYTIPGSGTIESITLDSLNLTNIDYMKIDVEGNELDVLKGSINTINQNKPLIEFEYNGLSNTLFGISKKDIDIFLEKMGYNYIHRMDDNFFYSHESINNLAL